MTANSFKTMQLSGMQELCTKLLDLPQKLRRNVYRKVLIKGTEIVKEEARRLAPKRSTQIDHGWESFVGNDDEEHLRDNIVNMVKIKPRSNKGRVGIQWENIRYGHLLEFGHRIVLRRRDTGRRSKKLPFMRPAYDAKSEQALEVMLTDLKRAVEENAK